MVCCAKENDNGRIRTYAPNGNSLAGSRLNHSATLSCLLCSSTSTTSDTQKSALGWKRKRQWQDLNLRIRRIIDFKSIALDHSATLSLHLSVVWVYMSASCVSRQDEASIVRECSSDGRALALHARGRGIDTPHFHCIVCFFLSGMGCSTQHASSSRWKCQVSQWKDSNTLWRSSRID